MMGLPRRLLTSFDSIFSFLSLAKNVKKIGFTQFLLLFLEHDQLFSIPGLIHLGFGLGSDIFVQILDSCQLPLDGPF